MCQFENVCQKNKVSHFRLALCLLSELRQIVRKTAQFVRGTHDGRGNSNGCGCYGVAVAAVAESGASVAHSTL